MLTRTAVGVDATVTVSGGTDSEGVTGGGFVPVPVKRTCSVAADGSSVVSMAVAACVPVAVGVKRSVKSVNDPAATVNGSAGLTRVNIPLEKLIAVTRYDVVRLLLEILTVL